MKAQPHSSPFLASRLFSDFILTFSMYFWIPQLTDSIFLKKKGVCVCLQWVVTTAWEVLSGRLMFFLAWVSAPSVLTPLGIAYDFLSQFVSFSWAFISSLKVALGLPIHSLQQRQLLPLPGPRLLVRLGHDFHSQSFSRSRWDSGDSATNLLLRETGKLSGQAKPRDPVLSC